MATCMMGNLFPTVGSLRCDKEGTEPAGKIQDVEYFLCLPHSYVFWGFFVLPNVLNEQQFKGGEETKNG